jgi:hypothetical protein
MAVTMLLRSRTDVLESGQIDPTVKLDLGGAALPRHDNHQQGEAGLIARESQRQLPTLLRSPLLSEHHLKSHCVSTSLRTY